MHRYRVTKTLGDGTYGTVCKAVHVATGDTVAIKTMKRPVGAWQDALALREVVSLRALCHPCLVQLREVIAEAKQLHLVFEALDVNLFDIIRTAADEGLRGLPLPLIRNVAWQVLQGLAFMHKQGYFHRDIKPENCLVRLPRLPRGEGDDDPRAAVVAFAAAPIPALWGDGGPALHSRAIVKVADFGLTRDVRAITPFTQYVSTRWYRAPEVLLRHASYTPAVDTFAVGCILAELATLQPLAPGATEADQVAKLCAALGPPAPSTWPEGCIAAATLGYTLPRPRSSAGGVVGYCTGTDVDKAALSAAVPPAARDPAFLALLAGLLCWNPARRLTASAALSHDFFTSPLQPARFQWHGERDGAVAPPPGLPQATTSEPLSAGRRDDSGDGAGDDDDTGAGGGDANPLPSNLLGATMRRPVAGEMMAAAGGGPLEAIVEGDTTLASEAPSTTLGSVRSSASTPQRSSATTGRPHAVHSAPAPVTPNNAHPSPPASVVHVAPPSTNTVSQPHAATGVDSVAAARPAIDDLMLAWAVGEAPRPDTTIAVALPASGRRSARPPVHTPAPDAGGETAGRAGTTTALRASKSDFLTALGFASSSVELAAARGGGERGSMPQADATPAKGGRRDDARSREIHGGEGALSPLSRFVAEAGRDGAAGRPTSAAATPQLHSSSRWVDKVSAAGIDQPRSASARGSRGDSVSSSQRGLLRAGQTIMGHPPPVPSTWVGPHVAAATADYAWPMAVPVPVPVAVPVPVPVTMPAGGYAWSRAADPAGQTAAPSLAAPTGAPPAPGRWHGTHTDATRGASWAVSHTAAHPPATASATTGAPWASSTLTAAAELAAHGWTALPGGAPPFSAASWQRGHR